MSTPLYEITARYRQAVNDLNEIDVGEDIIRDTLGSIEGEFEEKAKAVIAFALNLEAELLGVKAARERMQGRERSLLKKIDWLKQYVMDNMQASEIKEIKTPEFKVSLRKCPDRVEIMDEAKIPSIFKVTETTFKVDKKLIKEFGGCEGARIVNGYTLNIR